METVDGNDMNIFEEDVIVDSEDNDFYWFIDCEVTSQ